MPHRDDFAIVTIDGHYRRLIKHDAAVGTIYESVDGTEIYSELVFEKRVDEFHGYGSSSGLAGPRKRWIAFKTATRMPQEISIMMAGDVFEVIKND
jgi:hypothetical protein